MGSLPRKKKRFEMKAFRRFRFPLLEVIVAVFAGMAIFSLVLLLLNFSRPKRTPVGVVTAVLTVIPAPTETPASATATPTSPAPTGDDDSPRLEGLYVGAYAQVVGTGGDGLRIREGPGLDYEPLFLALDGEIFLVDDGPQEQDGYSWWRLEAPYDQDRSGWAVSSYLEAVVSP
jgi:hypothetical protein